MFRSTACVAVACLGLAWTGTASANLLGNPGFETPDASGGDVGNAPGAPWTGFNQGSLRFTTAAVARSGDQSLKMFGPFDNIGGGVGATQLVAVTGGTTYVLEVYGLNNSADPIQGENFALAKIEFFDANQQFVAGPNNEPAGTALLGYNVFETNQLTAGTPQDTWTLLGAGGVAPAGAAYANIVLVQVQLGDGAGGVVGGSVFFDDASFDVPEPASLALLAGAAPLMLRRRRR